MTQATGHVQRGTDNKAQRTLARLIFAAVIMAAAGITLISNGIWALSFHGAYPRDLTRVLDGNSLTTAGVVFLVVGIVLVICAAGVLAGPRLNRWVGLVSRLAEILIGAAGALAGIWLVAWYPAWAITYTVLGAAIVYTLTLHERELRSPWPWAALRTQAAKVVALNAKGLNIARGAAAAGLILMAASHSPCCTGTNRS